MEMYDEVILDGISCIFVTEYDIGVCIIERSDGNGWPRTDGDSYIPTDYKEKYNNFWATPMSGITLVNKTFTDPYKQELYDTIQELKRTSAEIRRDVL